MIRRFRRGIALYPFFGWFCYNTRRNGPRDVHAQAPLNSSAEDAYLVDYERLPGAGQSVDRKKVVGYRTEPRGISGEDGLGIWSQRGG